MNKNSHFLKTILTTTSTFALALGSTVEAHAAQAPVVLGTVTPNSNTASASWNNGNIPTAPFSNGDSILLEHVGDNINLNALIVNGAPAAPIIAAIDLNGLSPSGSITALYNNAQLGSIGNGLNGTATISLEVNDGDTLILTGTQAIAGAPGAPGGNPTVGVNDYSGLGAVTLGSGGGAASTLNIAPTTPGAITFTNTFDSNAASAHYGIINLSAGKHIFKGVIGGNKQLDSINVTDASTITFGANTTANTINLAVAGAGVIFSGGTITADIKNTSGSFNNNIIVGINGGDVTLAGSIGAANTAAIGALNFQTNNILTLDATSAPRSIYAPITTAMPSQGKLTITGGNVSIFNDIGVSGIALGWINFGSDNTLTIDTNNGARSLYVSYIMSNDIGKGTLEFTGSNNALINGNIGGPYSAPKKVNLATDLTLTIANAVYISAPITTSTDGKGSLFLTGSNATINANIGASDAGLKEMRIASNNIITIDATAAARSINAPITTATDDQGVLAITGGDVSIFGNIGTTGNGGAKLNMVQIASANNLQVTGSIYATSILFGDPGSQLTILGGAANSAQVVSANITHNSDPNYGQGIVNVGNGSAASFVNFTGTIGTDANHTIRLLNIIGSSNAANASTATISANSYFRSGQASEGGIIIGQNATLNVASGAALSFTDATIEGTVAGSGTLLLSNINSIPTSIGGNTSLGTVRLNNFNGGTKALLGNTVNATNLDLAGNSFIMLDSKATNITNFTSTTTNNSNIDFVGYNGTGALNVQNIFVPLTLYSTGTLTVYNATQNITFNCLQGGNPNLIATDNASIGNVAVLVQNQSGAGGTLTTLGNATFTGTIGATGLSLQNLTWGGSQGDVVTLTSATDIYAASMTHNNVTLDAHANNITMHGNYSANSAVLTLADKKITLAQGSSATIAGTLDINATYTANGQTVLDFSAATELDASTMTNLTLNINNGGSTPAAGSVINVIKTPTTVMMPTNSLKVSLGTSDTKWSYTSFGVLTYNPSAVVSANSSFYSPSSDIIVTTQDNYIVGATSSGILAAAAVNSNQITISPTGGPITFITTTIDGTSVLDLGTGSLEAYTAQYTTDESKKGWTAILYATLQEKPEVELSPSTSAVYGTIASQEGLIPTAMADALIHPEVGGTSPDLVQEMTKAAASGGAAVANELIDRLGASANNAASDSLNALASRVESFFSTPSAGFESPPPPTPVTSPSGGSGAGTVSSPATQAPSKAATGALIKSGTAEEEGPGEDLEAVAYGAAAGSSPYDKFGVWLSVNAGHAKQNERKGNSGFKSISNGFALGVDTMISDRASIGVTVSNSFNHIKYRDSNHGNKTDSSSWVGAIYGNYQLRNNWFVRGAALFNRTRMNSKELRVIQGGYGMAQAKYNLISYGGEAAIGFRHRLQGDIILSPSIGFRVLHNNKSSFGQSGNTFQNNKVLSDAMNNYSALAGLSIAKTIVKSEIDFTPEAHANFQYGVNMKSPTGKFVSALTPNQTTNFIGSKASPLTSVYGLSLTASNERIECGINGDISIADKYVGYQGSLKLKVKF